MFVIPDLERVSRGLKPVLGVNTQINGWAATAARRGSSVVSWDLSNGTELQVLGSVRAGDLNSDTEAIASYTGAKPTLTYTWATAWRREHADVLTRPRAGVSGACRPTGDGD